VPDPVTDSVGGGVSRLARLAVAVPVVVVPASTHLHRKEKVVVFKFQKP
jgi:hypothetical protein